MSGLKVGTGRTRITPPWDVRLSHPSGGEGRAWTRLRDHLAATALVIETTDWLVALVALDLAALDASLVASIESQLATIFPQPPVVLVTPSGSPRCPTGCVTHPAADASYLDWVVRQTVTAIVLAHRSRRAATFGFGANDLTGWTHHRDDPSSPIDQRLVLWRFDDDGRRPLAAVLSFAAPAEVQAAQAPQEISRDYPGQVSDLLERELPGVTAVLLPGAARDTVFRPEYAGADRSHTPGVAIAQAALQCWRKARFVNDEPLSVARWEHRLVLRCGETGLVALPPQSSLDATAARASWKGEVLLVRDETLGGPLSSPDTTI
jgi:hypothetical protein